MAAFEVPLLSEASRNQFLAVLRDTAQAEGLHVDAANREDLEQQGKVDPAFKMTMNATVWRGAKDEEPIASAMDQPDHLGQVWISFFRGQDPALATRFRDRALHEIIARWPGTLSLPIMPTGAIPSHRDLVATPNGYVVSPSEAPKYALPSTKDGSP
ncbi:MAG TPA: hypothetical protein VGI91_09065 [Steroidobacteraceae bacterium]